MKDARRSGRASGAVTGFPYRLTGEADLLRLRAELQGVDEESIRIDLEGRTLIVSVDGAGRKLQALITLPWTARLGRKRFREGILELSLERSP